MKGIETMNSKIFASLAVSAVVLLGSARSHALCSRIANPYQFDSFYGALWGCKQELVNDMWYRFAFEAADWPGTYGYNDPCNDSTPLKRTFNAMQLLGYAMTASPTCSTSSSNVGMWAYCWAGNSIDEVYPGCEANEPRAHTSYGPFVDAYTKLFFSFFYDEDVIQRAGTLFHEARHAQGWCDHTDSCADGPDSCDPNWGSGCVGAGSSSGLGANGYTVLYMNWFATTARSNWINPTIRASAVAEGNYYLSHRFGTDPCFRLNAAGFPVTTC